jgi:hypothetical protein
MAARNRRHFSNPTAGFVPVKHHLVVIQAHRLDCTESKLRTREGHAEANSTFTPPPRRLRLSRDESLHILETSLVSALRYREQRWRPSGCGVG